MFYFGVDYYPEHWPEERWPEDARLMKEAGLKFVRLGEFAWSKFEPREGEFDFAWLDRAIAVLGGQGLRAVLGTPTAAPPPWLIAKHPEILPVNRHRMRVSFGGRQHFCPRNEHFREFTRGIVTALAEHYRDNPAVVGWQIDNEYRGKCYCDVCREQFQAWLERKYGTLAALNSAWGTVFWSQEYGSWREIPLPLSTIEVAEDGSVSSDEKIQNPGLRLDFSRFSSDSYLQFTRFQRELLAAIAPRLFTTHNVNRMLYHEIDYYDLAKEIDILTWNQYPLRHEGPPDPRQAALYLDDMRGAGGRNFWVVEQQSGPTGWGIIGARPEPGQVRLWTYQSIAHGADGIFFFRWRSCRFGTEEFWHGILEHDGVPRRCYREVARVGEEIDRLGKDLAGTAYQAEVAIVSSFDARWAFLIQPNNRGFGYEKHLRLYYDYFWDRGLPVEIVPPEAALARYKLVVVPALYVLGHVAAENLRRYVAGGGTLVVTMRSGVKDEHNTVVDAALPGLLADLLGVTVEEYDSMLPGDTFGVRLAPDGRAGQGEKEFRAAVWCEQLSPTDAHAVAVYTDGIYAGSPAVTCLDTGNGGRAIYVGIYPDAALLRAVLDPVLASAGIAAPWKEGEAVEMTTRRGADGREFIFLLNHTRERASVEIGGVQRDLLTGESCGPRVELEGYGVRILA